ncbi:MAG: TolC family protein [Proteobacteria bacterium]|nr:TolC family protein [Pseudomonadota bacterium]MBU4037481.1 TolC family protein [Pseudomonadota bacterium]
MTRIIKICLYLLLSVIPINAFSQPATLDTLVSKSLDVSPKLRMLEAKYKAAQMQSNVDSHLPDPMLTFGVANLPTDTFSFTQEPMTGKVIALSQAVPFPGKLDSIRDVNNKAAEIIKQEIEDAKNEIVKSVSQNYYELIFVRKAIEVAKENLKLLHNINQVVRTNYTVGKSSQQNLFKVELEITNLNDKIEELKNKENMVTAMLNASLLQSQDTHIITDDLPVLQYYDLTQQQLDSLVIQNRPYLAGIKLAKQRAKLQEKLANYDYYPNFNFLVQYSQRDRIAKTDTGLADFATFMVGISLPLNFGGKVSSKVEETQALQTMYDAQYHLSLQMLDGNFGTSISMLNSLQERIKLIQEVQLPQAQQTFSATLSSYQVGQVDFINVIDAQNKLYQIQTNLYRLKTDYFKEIEELKFLTGAKELK